MKRESAGTRNAVVVIALLLSLILPTAQGVSEEQSNYPKRQISPNDLPIVEKDPKYAKFGVLLQDLVETREESRHLQQKGSNLFRFSKGDPDRVLVDVVFDSETPNTATLHDSGCKITACYKHMCSAFCLVQSLTDIATDQTIRWMAAAIASTSVGAVTTEGDLAQRSNLVRSTYGLDGSGSRVGVLSDSYDCAPFAVTSASEDIASGDLPLNIDFVVEPDDCSGSIDEGRGMMQLIHDVAPGAELSFHTAFTGQADFAQGIIELAADPVNCNIVVDDVSYALEPWFQDGIIAQAVDTVAAQDVAYFSSAGNSGRNAWHRDATVTPISFEDGGFLDFNAGGVGGIDQLQRVSIKADIVGEILFLLQWDEPFASAGGVGSASDLDLYIYDPVTNELLDQSVESNVGGDAVDGLRLTGFSPFESVELDLAILLFSGPEPQYIKWATFLGEIESVEYNILSSYFNPHAFTEGGAGVGAAKYSATPVFGVSPAEQEPFSSAGGSPIFFDAAGNRLTDRVVRDQPRFTGPDGGATTFFGEFDDSTLNYRFFGTSASAPHVAAIAALMREVDPTLTPDSIFSILEETALDMDDSATPEFDIGFDFGTGYGFVDALSAVEQVFALGTTDLPLDKVGNFGLPASVYPLSQCQGDCENSDECQGDLVCLQRGLQNPFNDVPGCMGTSDSVYTDYCISISSLEPDTLISLGSEGMPESVFPLQKCQGNCRFNDDCAGTRTYGGTAQVPGCTGTLAQDDTNYCYDVTDIPSSPSLLTTFAKLALDAIGLGGFF